MSNREYEFNREVQTKLLALYVRRPNRVGAFIEPGYFSDDMHVDIARVVSEIRAKHPKDRTGQSILRAAVKTFLGAKRRDAWPHYKNEIRAIFTNELDDRHIVTEEARKFALERQHRRALTQSEKFINAGHYSAAAQVWDELRVRLATPESRLFHSYSDFKHAPELTFAIEGFLQNDAATLIGGLSGHGKTWVMLSMAKALLTGDKLWGHFKVPRKSHHVVYLIPESSIAPFKHRLAVMRLLPFVKSGCLKVHTLSAGPKPALDDPRVLAAAKHSHIFLDTAIRFGDGEENDASDNQQGLATAIFRLLSAGAKTIAGAHHSPKGFSNQNQMTLENVLRGSGDIGAMVATAWGVKQLDAQQNVLHIENLKCRDFDACRPFQIIGRPHIDREGDFRMLKKPGTCGSLADEQPKPGASMEAREARSKNLSYLREWLHENPKLTAGELVRKFKKVGIQVQKGTVRRYRSEIRKHA